ncbi:MAG: guanylate kinase [Acidimicrobiales bacterium]|nr:guanylate kinase [Acidimicrobiales bacterium]
MIFVISGPAGVGKGTVVARLLTLDPELRLSRSWTTRPRRPREPADAYVFVDRKQFQSRLAAQGFLEWNEFAANGQLYGTPVPEAGDGDLLLEIELNGAEQVKAADPGAVLIFITAPSREAREARLRHRGDDEPSIARRLAVGDEEEALGAGLADHLVVNDDVDRAAREVAGIIAARRNPPNLE